MKAKEELIGWLPQKDESEEHGPGGDCVENRVVNRVDQLSDAFLGAAPNHAAVLDEEDKAEQSVAAEACSTRVRDVDGKRGAKEEEVSEEDERPSSGADREGD